MMYQSNESLKLAQNFAVLQADARNAERERDRREYEEARREDLEAVPLTAVPTTAFEKARSPPPHKTVWNGFGSAMMVLLLLIHGAEEARCS